MRQQPPWGCAWGWGSAHASAVHADARRAPQPSVLAPAKRAEPPPACLALAACCSQYLSAECPAWEYGVTDNLEDVVAAWGDGEPAGPAALPGGARAAASRARRGSGGRLDTCLCAVLATSTPL